MGQSVDVRCDADVDMRSGVTKYLLLVNPDDPINGESIWGSLRRSTVDLHSGTYYRVTFDEIPPPVLALAPEAA
jgi:hypothetical protein